ncbi:MAG TPA: hypothetical protein ENI34_03290 [candidate division WOR-3 bacterium]|uniref:Transglutaminase-like domain-containing protein n=1 Tax=candidate division WOR-3 bacterium TaxID=2052148 RepID=A0A9C9ELR6_UNCW3|nr:hypothetical protein [candidate division WOR-3 bacterium]
MKKSLLFVSIIIFLFTAGILCKNIFAQQKLFNVASRLDIKENNCFNQSYNQLSDSLIAVWDSIFQANGIKDEPFAMMLYLIEWFNQMSSEETTGYHSIAKISSTGKTNLRSSILAVCAIMQKFGWDILCFYNEDECYLGLALDETWKIRKANWVEKNNKNYYLKEFDTVTPVGELKIDNPASKYRSIKAKKENLNPIPIIRKMPVFGDPVFEKVLKWYYKNMEYNTTVSIPKAQIEWTQNLPPSLYGMTNPGIIELKRIGLVDRLKIMLNNFQEYDRVNFLLKFCQSESIFIYDSKQQIQSVSKQLTEGYNDCDGRSIFLYCLLRAVLDYSDEDIIFLSWPNHLALGLRPKTEEAVKILEENDGYSVNDKFYILDPTYLGNTGWGSKMKRLSNDCEIIE